MHFCNIKNCNYVLNDQWMPVWNKAFKSKYFMHVASYMLVILNSVLS